MSAQDWDKEEDESDLSEHDRDLDDPFTPDVSSSDKLSKKRNLNQKTNKGKKPKVSGGKKR